MERKPIAVIFEDDSLLVVDKPSGILTVPADAGEGIDLTARLNEHAAEHPGAARAYPCHRLDRETSGVVIFAKGKAVQKMMMEQFRQRQVSKKYIAFVQGRWDRSCRQLKGYIQKEGPYQARAPKLLAITRIQPLVITAMISVLELEPVTGRTNQLRIQLRDAGHPIIGERRFVFAKDWPIRFKRVALHARQVTFEHPRQHTPLSLESPLPRDMREFLEQQKIRLPHPL